MGKQSQNCFALYRAATPEVSECDLSMLNMQAILRIPAIGQLLQWMPMREECDLPQPALTLAGIWISFLSLTHYTPNSVFLSYNAYSHILSISYSSIPLPGIKIFITFLLLL